MTSWSLSYKRSVNSAVIPTTLSCFTGRSYMLLIHSNLAFKNGLHDWHGWK